MIFLWSPVEFSSLRVIHCCVWMWWFLCCRAVSVCVGLLRGVCMSPAAACVSQAVTATALWGSSAWNRPKWSWNFNLSLCLCVRCSTRTTVRANVWDPVSCVWSSLCLCSLYVCVYVCRSCAVVWWSWWSHYCQQSRHWSHYTHHHWPQGGAHYYSAVHQQAG